jgi:hypothetical protein
MKIRWLFHDFLSDKSFGDNMPLMEEESDFFFPEKFRERLPRVLQKKKKILDNTFLIKFQGRIQGRGPGGLDPPFILFF